MRMKFTNKADALRLKALCRALYILSEGFAARLRKEMDKIRASDQNKQTLEVRTERTVMGFVQCGVELPEVCFGVDLWHIPTAKFYENYAQRQRPVNFKLFEQMSQIFGQAGPGWLHYEYRLN
jgi:acyl CoA:acetate/3-ketoacid CoA transferase